MAWLKARPRVWPPRRPGSPPPPQEEALAYRDRVREQRDETLALYKERYLPRVQECYNELIAAGLADDSRRRRILEAPEKHGIGKAAQILWTMGYFELRSL